MHNPQQLLMQAVQLHNAGNLDAAERLYQQVLAVNPRNPDALHLSGLLAFQRQNFQQAVTLFKRAIKGNPKVADFHNNLGEALRLQGKSVQAREAYSQALALDPNHVLSLNNLGAVCRELGQERQASELFKKALKVKPDYPEAHFNLGQLLFKQGQTEAAIEHFLVVERLNPGFAPVRTQLGNAYRAAGQFEAALACYQKALAANPRDLAALGNQGECLFRLGRLPEAETCLHNALSMNWKLAALHNTLGSVQLEQGQAEAALDSFRNAIELEPQLQQGHLNLGMAYRELRRLDEALACYERALELDPQSPEAHFSRGFTLLMRGDWERGWQDYEWRFQSVFQAPLPQLQSRLWDGSAEPESRLLLLAEQGFGDTLMAVRFATQLQGQFREVWVQAPAPLAGLIETLPGIDGVCVTGDPLPAHEVHCPLMSLPQRLGATPESVAAAVPYLSASAESTQRWSQRVQALGDGIKVGICWAGSRANPKNRKRQLGLAALGELVELEEIHWVSLQKEVEESELALIFRWGDRLHHWMDEVDSFQETAALIQALDLVITQDSAVAHLAGALGKPVWTLVPFIHDWRWLTKREDSPWYPSMRLFRQASPDSWQAEVGAVRRSLQERIGGRPTLAPGHEVASAAARASLPSLPSLDHFNKLKACRHGLMLFNRHDAYVGRSLDQYGEFSELELALLGELLTPGDVVVDAGANIGVHSLFMAQQVGETGRVYAFEPQRLVFQTLCANLALNGILNTRAFQAALGSRSGDIQVPRLDPHQPHNYGGVSLEGVTAGESVPLMTIDGLRLERCRLIKVDVEGMEEQVLEGAQATLARCRPLLYVENDRLEKSATLLARIRDLGYRAYPHEPPLFNADNFAGNRNNIFGTLVSGNLLCVPDAWDADKTERILDVLKHRSRS